METSLQHPNSSFGSLVKVLGIFKLRIGIVIMFTALAGLAVTPGASLSAWQMIVFALAVLISSASAGAFNQYVEYDTDRYMARTRGRSFATGELPHTPAWLWLIASLLVLSVGATWIAANAVSALFVFLGAFFYAVVYTVWLKRRTWLNIVIGGLAGSFAVLAGASAVNPDMGALPWALALILFLWTPPHFWSLAVACRDDYEAAGIPMLPVVIGIERASKVILGSAIVLVAASFLPAFLGLGMLYLAGAAIGGVYFIWKAWLLVRAPGRNTAMSAFHASLMQLTLLLVTAMVDARF